MSIQVISGGCRGVDSIAMFWADVYHVPFQCFLPSHHAMKQDLETDSYPRDSTRIWCIALDAVLGARLFKRHGYVSDGKTMCWAVIDLDRSTLASRFTVAPQDDAEAALACQTVNSNFARYTPVVKAYLQRDYLIAKHSDNVIAFGYLNTGRSMVIGGTGWTVRLAQQLNKPVYLYHIPDEQWLIYDYSLKKFTPSPCRPVLKDKCAIVGSREFPATSSVTDEIHKLLHAATTRPSSQKNDDGP